MYSGILDELAAIQYDGMVSYSRYNEPRKEDVLNELYRKIYPQVKNRISYAVDW